MSTPTEPPAPRAYKYMLILAREVWVTSHVLTDPDIVQLHFDAAREEIRHQANRTGYAIDGWQQMVDEAASSPALDRVRLVVEAAVKARWDGLWGHLRAELWLDGLLPDYDLRTAPAALKGRPQPSFGNGDGELPAMSSSSGTSLTFKPGGMVPPPGSPPAAGGMTVWGEMTDEERLDRMAREHFRARGRRWTDSRKS